MNPSRGLLAAALLIAALCPTARAADELPPPIYAIKQDVPSLGTNIPRKVATSSDLPLNRRYSELTAAEQDIVKSRYEAMMPLDEPPYPVDGLLPLFNAVRKVQDAVLAQGDLTMFVEVDAQGRATSVSVMKSPDPKLTQAVASVLMLTKYKPAVCGGQPCSMGYPFRMKFSVDHR
ncbi:MAG TPA: energy transducer TonB [Burkholderiaceae bacterium]|nr:energy transducer TonB [Burkholderiaceae bacterium]